MPKKLRCLIIDDNAEVLPRLKLSLEDPASFYLGSGVVDYEVDVDVLPIACLEQQGRVVISDPSAAALSSCFSEQFDFIFTDFAFVSDRDKSEAFTESHKQPGQRITIDQCRPFTAFLPDLTSTHPAVAQSLASFTGEVVVYTHSPPPYDQLVLGTQKELQTATFKLLFKNASGVTIYNYYDILKSYPETDEQKREVMSSSVLAMYLRSTLERNTHCRLIGEQHRKRRRLSKKNIRWITIGGIALGALTALFGDLVYHHVVESYSAFYAAVVGTEPWEKVVTQLLAVSGAVCIAFVFLVRLAVWAAGVLETFTNKLYEDDNL